MVERDAFKVGKDLALSPGAVVQRDEVGEVLQYQPSTEQVYQRPLRDHPAADRPLLLPRPAPRAAASSSTPPARASRCSCSAGATRPPSRRAGTSTPTPARVLVGHRRRARDLRQPHDVNVMGFCAGGIITTTLLNHLAAIGDDRVHSMSYAVTLLDFGERAPISAFQAPSLLRFAKARSRRSGIITSRQMGAAFTWMRPDDLVFNYWVNNYLMGDKPPAFDILAWNADGTNLPGALHGEFLDIFEGNLLTQPGGLSVLGSPMQLDDDQGADVRHRRGRRPPHAVAGLLPHHPAARRRGHVRAELLRAHREPGQPARQPEGALLDRRLTRARSAEVARRGDQAPGQLVGGLDRVVQAVRRRAEAAPRARSATSPTRCSTRRPAATCAAEACRSSQSSGTGRRRSAPPTTTRCPPPGGSSPTVVGDELARRGLRDPEVVAGTLRRQQHTASLLVEAAGYAGPCGTDKRWNEFDHLALLRRYVEPSRIEPALERLARVPAAPRRGAFGVEPGRRVGGVLRRRTGRPARRRPTGCRRGATRWSSAPAG